MVSFVSTNPLYTATRGKGCADQGSKPDLPRPPNDIRAARALLGIHFISLAFHMSDYSFHDDFRQSTLRDQGARIVCRRRLAPLHARQPRLFLHTRADPGQGGERAAFWTPFSAQSVLLSSNGTCTDIQRLRVPKLWILCSRLSVIVRVRPTGMMTKPANEQARSTRTCTTLSRAAVSTIIGRPKA